MFSCIPTSGPPWYLCPFLLALFYCIKIDFWVLLDPPKDTSLSLPKVPPLKFKMPIKSTYYLSVGLKVSGLQPPPSSLILLDLSAALISLSLRAWLSELVDSLVPLGPNSFLVKNRELVPSDLLLNELFSNSSGFFEKISFTTTQL